MTQNGVSYLGVCHVSIYSCLCVANIPTILLILYPTTLFKKCVPCCGFSGVECTVHICWIISRTVQGWYCAFRIVSASFLILRLWIIAKVYLLRHIITNCFSSQLLPVAMHGITRPNFMNNVDVLILFLIAWDVIMCNKWLFTKILYIHCFVTCSTHDADT